MKIQNPLPSYRCYTRLAPSTIHGVGVFAINDIKKGTYIFYEDDEPMQEIDPIMIAPPSPEMKKLYDDFCPMKDGKYLCPSNFNKLPISWYLNHSNSPNANCDENYEFYANRDIKIGEEITVNYNTYDTKKETDDYR